MISICIAYYNRKEQFLRTLAKLDRSIDFELCIVDDGSSEDQRIDSLIDAHQNPKSNLFTDMPFDPLKIKYKRINPENKNRRNHRLSKKRKEDPAFKLRSNISRSVRRALFNNNSIKNSSTWESLPYTPQELKFHLESLFEDWMTWDNYGVFYVNGKSTWHIDHIIPQSLLPYTSFEDENFKKCWALENLRPLKALENIKKGNKLC